MQTPTVNLGSELDVGHGLLKGCSSILAEAGALCSGRKPFRLYAEPSSACKAYFWCAPGRGACLLSCPQGELGVRTVRTAAAWLRSLCSKAPWLLLLMRDVLGRVLVIWMA